MSSDVILVECFDEHGRMVARERFSVKNGDSKITIGRCVSADVSVDDGHIAEKHVSLELTSGGRIVISDLGSLNGILINGKRQERVQNVPLPNDRFQIGRTQIRVRTSLDKLMPERPLVLQRPANIYALIWIAGLGAAASISENAYANWLQAPSDLVADFVSSTVIAIFAVAAWVAIWALLSRVMLGEWRWIEHAAIVLGVLAVYLFGKHLTQLLWFMYGLPAWRGGSVWFIAFFLALILFGHVRLASRASTRLAAAIAVAIPLFCASTMQWMVNRSARQDVNAIAAYLRIFPPIYRVQKAMPADLFFNRIERLRAVADRKRDELPAVDNGYQWGLPSLSLMVFFPARADDTPLRSSTEQATEKNSEPILVPR
ncbi:MAG: FHA domain-containing protein [Hyphomicrobiaceae bacterium]